jgi:hypothetical protein
MKNVKNMEEDANRWVIKTGFQNIIKAGGQEGIDAAGGGLQLNC